MDYRLLEPGEIVQTKGGETKESLHLNDQLFSQGGMACGPGWLDAPACWNEHKVTEDLPFRRPCPIK